MKPPPRPLGWQRSAACISEDPSLFFGTDGETGDEFQVRETAAKRICAGCTVRRQCLDLAMSLPPESRRFGVWGGMGEGDRRHLRRSATIRKRQQAPSRAA